MEEVASQKPTTPRVVDKVYNGEARYREILPCLWHLEVVRDGEMQKEPETKLGLTTE